MGLVAPPSELWDKVGVYVEKGGGQVVVIPGADELLADGSDKPPPGYDNRWLPGRLKQWIELPTNGEGVTWTWDALKIHPLLNDFREWQKNLKIDFVALKPRTWGYWDVEAKDKPSVIVSYADAPDADQRRPALLEKLVGERGRVLLFTTPMGGRYFNSLSGAWNSYAQNSSFYLVLSNLTLRYMTGDAEDAQFNYDSGSTVLVKWPLDAATRSKTYYLYGPDLADADMVQTRDDKSAFLRLTPDKLRSAGNYEIVSDPSDKDHPKWRDGFSLNATKEESNLERVKVEDIEARTPDGRSLFTVAAADKERKLRDILSGNFGAPIELFPFLMILLLLFLAFENLLSNKFYKQPKPPPSATA
jgi:hypothetical protein